MNVMKLVLASMLTIFAGAAFGVHASGYPTVWTVRNGAAKGLAVHCTESLGKERGPRTLKTPVIASGGEHKHAWKDHNDGLGLGKSSWVCRAAPAGVDVAAAKPSPAFSTDWGEMVSLTAVEAKGGFTVKKVEVPGDVATAKPTHGKSAQPD